MSLLRDSVPLPIDWGHSLSYAEFAQTWTTLGEASSELASWTFTCFHPPLKAPPFADTRHSGSTLHILLSADSKNYLTDQEN